MCTTQLLLNRVSVAARTHKAVLPHGQPVRAILVMHPELHALCVPIFWLFREVTCAIWSSNAYFVPFKFHTTPRHIKHMWSIRLGFKDECRPTVSMISDIMNFIVLEIWIISHCHSSNTRQSKPFICCSKLGEVQNFTTTKFQIF